MYGKSRRSCFLMVLQTFTAEAWASFGASMANGQVEIGGLN